MIKRSPICKFNLHIFCLENKLVFDINALNVSIINMCSKEKVLLQEKNEGIFVQKWIIFRVEKKKVRITKWE